MNELLRLLSKFDDLEVKLKQDTLTKQDLEDIMTELSTEKEALFKYLELDKEKEAMVRKYIALQNDTFANLVYHVEKGDL